MQKMCKRHRFVRLRAVLIDWLRIYRGFLAAFVLVVRTLATAGQEAAGLKHTDSCSPFLSVVLVLLSGWDA